MLGIDNTTITATCPYMEAILNLFASPKKMKFMSLRNNFSVMTAQNSAKTQTGKASFLSLFLKNLHE